MNTASWVAVVVSIWGIACLFAMALCRGAANGDRGRDREFEMEAQQ
jgi:hypothetical protein